MRIIPDKAEVAVEFPDKAYMGSFGHNARFEVRSDAGGIALRLERHDGGEKREVDVHLHHGLFADILDETANVIAAQPPIDEPHRDALLKAARRLVDALKAKR
jgi:hypothetical protein